MDKPLSYLAWLDVYKEQLDDDGITDYYQAYSAYVDTWAEDTFINSTL